MNRNENAREGTERGQSKLAAMSFMDTTRRNSAPLPSTIIRNDAATTIHA